jgi:membrane protein
VAIVVDWPFSSLPAGAMMSTTKRRLWAALHLGGLSFRDVAIRTWARIDEHEIFTRAAAITFYAIAALVPFLALVITLTAHIVMPPVREAVSGTTQPAGPMDELVRVMPSDAASVVAKEIERLQEGPPTGLVSFGLVATLWLSSSLFVAIMDAMNRILGVREMRPWWKRREVAVLMALSQAAILIVVFATILAWPQILRFLRIDLATALLVTAAHAILVFLVFLLSFALALYFGPDADQCWEWITPGSLLGSVVLVAVSYLFRVYVQNWGNYSATYGSLGGIVVLMSWIWLCALALLTAGELNKVIKDATPLGDPYEPPPSNEDRHARERAPGPPGPGEVDRRG